MKKMLSILVATILIASCTKDSTSNIVVDIDGNVYDTVKICSQIWMKQNLNTSRYRNGDPIPRVTDPTAWAALTTGAYCYYNNDSATYAATYGKLYNWYAVNDPRGLAPNGWHVATDVEWNTLVKCIDPSADTTCTGCSQSSSAGGAMKETGTTHWLAPNTGATNSSRFTGLPGVLRFDDGTFPVPRIYSYWWSSSEFNTTSVLNRVLFYASSTIGRSPSTKQNGFSVRCIKD